MISVLLPVYNEPIDYIKKSVRSILTQTYADLELLVIIDKPDRSDVFSYLSQEKKKDSRVRIIKNDSNLGLTKSLNKTIKLAKGQYVARMDADDISVEDRLEKQLAFLEENGLDLAGGAIRNMTQNGVVSEKIIYFPGNAKTSRKLLKYNTAAAHPAWLAKKELFEKYKYIDYPACEDYEFLVRIALDGKKIANLPEVILFYRLNENGISSNKKGLQKTSLYYVRKQYRKNHKCEYEAFEAYINSKRGKRVIAKTKRYYEKIECIKARKKCISSLLLLLTLPANNIALGHMYGTFRSRIIRGSKVFKRTDIEERSER